MELIWIAIQKFKWGYLQNHHDYLDISQEISQSFKKWI